MQKSEETLINILAACNGVSSSLFLAYRHDRIGYVVYEKLLRAPTPLKVPKVTKFGNKEI